jgi:hypothetical protein
MNCCAKLTMAMDMVAVLSQFEELEPRVNGNLAFDG